MRPIRFSVALTALAFAGLGAPSAFAQMSASDLVVRLETMENQMRQLTGQIEQLQFRNQQLEQQLRRVQQDTDYRFQEMGGKGGPGGAQGAQPGPRTPPVPQQSAPQPSPQTAPAVQPLPGRRSDAPELNDPASGPSPIRPLPSRRDVFDPNANPVAPGAPRPLGSLPAGQPSAPQIMTDEQPVGARGGREAGNPLDLSTMSGSAPARDTGNAVASVAPPQAPQTPKDEYDGAYRSIQNKDYALAEQSFREFLRRFPNDRLVPEAQYWLGESLFQRQLYRDAAENFLAVSTKHETSAKAPDSLLRLGQSLAALGEKNAACATLNEIGRKYPRASVGVKRGAEREQKRVEC